MIDKLLITVCCLIVGLAIAMQMFYYSLPLFKRLEFDMICHAYVSKMDQQGGLTAEQKSELADHLVLKDFQIQHMEITAQGEYGQPLLFEVTVSFLSRKLNAGLAFSDNPLQFSYSADLLCRVMRNGWQS